jgi:multiple sugar transport system substrate-binding protein
MQTMTCDKDTEVQITKDTQDYTNTISGMNELANSDFKSDFLGGQNHIKLFAEAAPKINMKNISAYDQGLNEEFQKAMKDYFDGNVTKDKALDNFYKAATEKYPNLTH